MLVLIGDGSLTVHVVTANFIWTDWHNKTNGVWTGTFPRRRPDLGDRPDLGELGDFGADLRQYYAALKSLGTAQNPPNWPTKTPKSAWAVLGLEWTRDYDFSACNARLVASVPGRHTGSALGRWGHARVRSLLLSERADPKFVATCPLIMQASVSV